MAIHPIDLQTMYAQMSNVARIAANQQNGAQLTDALLQNKKILQNAEQIATVQKTADDEAKATKVKPDGKKNTGGQAGDGKKEEQSSESGTKKEVEFRESYLGQHIDITR